MSKYTEHFHSELKKIVEVLNANPKRVESIGNIVACAKFDYDFIKSIICGIKEVWVMDKAIQVITDKWHECEKKKDERCFRVVSRFRSYDFDEYGIYETSEPIKMSKYFNLNEDLKSIKAAELERRRIEEEYKKGLNEKIDNEMKDEEINNLDFERLKDYHEKKNLDDYISNKHWNSHVNRLLHKTLLIFHEGKELGAFLDVKRDRMSKPIKDYTPLYCTLFNEAYRLCSNVLKTSVPQTKVAKFADQAATWKFRNLKDQNGKPINLAPNATDLIESYHILGMANAILIFSNIQNDDVNEFLIALSVYKDEGLMFRGYNHSFGNYIEVYESFIAATIIDGSYLRPGYDNKSRDKYLRKNIPWYQNLVKDIEMIKQEAENKKTSNATQQHNVNSNVFNNCQVNINNIYATADAPVENQNKNKCAGKQAKKNKPEKQHGVEYPVFSKGLGVTDYHIKALYNLLTTRGWISTQTKEADFQRLFNGEDNDCEIIWTGQDKLGNNEPTTLGVSALYVLFKNMVDEKFITTGSNSERVGPILESHFVNTEGHFLTDVSNVSTVSKKANNYINKILVTMRMRANQGFIQDNLESDLKALIEQEGEDRYNRYEP